MVGWYLEHQQAVQATLLMREWLISAFMGIQGLFPFDDRDKRVVVETQYNNAAYALISKGKDGINDFCDDIQTLPDPCKVIHNWQKLAQMRNDIAHCGHRKNAQHAQALIVNASRIYQDLCQIAADIFPMISKI